MERRRASNWLTPPRSSARLTAMCQRSSPPITFVTRYSSTWKAFCVAIATSRPRQPPLATLAVQANQGPEHDKSIQLCVIGYRPVICAVPRVIHSSFALGRAVSLSHVRAGTGGEDLSRIINSWNNGIESRRCAQPSHFNNAFCRFCYIASIYPILVCSVHGVRVYWSICRWIWHSSYPFICRGNNTKGWIARADRKGATLLLSLFNKRNSCLYI